MPTPHLHTFAKVTSKGQLTIPKEVRSALNIQTGDRLAFEIAGDEIVVRKSVQPQDLLGTVETPPEIRGRSFHEVRELARAARLNP